MADKPRGSGRNLSSISAVDSGTFTPPGARRGVLFLQIVVAYFVALKLVYGLFAPPNGDEAYYWLWGSHLQLSYYDHAPMVGWTSALSRLALGWTPVGLHFPAFISFLVLAYTLHRAARWLAPEDPTRHFWLGLAIFCASPLLNALTTPNYPDHLLICFASLAILSLGKWLNGALTAIDRPADLYVGALFLGLAGLSKYNAVFIAAGLLTVLIAVPRLRRLFRSPHLYVAGALTFAVTLPVYIWNAEHHFASVELHAVDRLSAGGTFVPATFVSLIAVSILMLSPFLIVAMGRFLFGRTAEVPQTGLILLGRSTALISTLFLLPLSAWSALGDQVKPHWLVLSFLPFLLVAPLYLRSRWMIGLHLGWGVLINTVLVIYYVLAPLPTELLGLHDGEAVRTFGQDQLAVAASRMAADNGAIAIAIADYLPASMLAFALRGDQNITDLGGRIDILTGRTFTAGDAGKDMLVIGNPSGLQRRFETMERLPPVEVQRFGHPLWTYDIWLGHDFKP
jgi:4-amino-4-deoxy-L-arabinose transferase-like glycosyltransferase